MYQGFVKILPHVAFRRMATLPPSIRPKAAYAPLQWLSPAPRTMACAGLRRLSGAGVRGSDRPADGWRRGATGTRRTVGIGLWRERATTYSTSSWGGLPVGPRPVGRPATAAGRRAARGTTPAMKTARVGPVGHPPARHIHRQAVDQLQAEPDAQHQPCRDREDLDQHDDDHEDIDPRPREHQQITAHHARDRARRAHLWARWTPGSARICPAAAESPEAKVEGQKAQMPQQVLHVVAEDVEKQHVPDQVHPGRRAGTSTSPGVWPASPLKRPRAGQAPIGRRTTSGAVRYRTWRGNS